MERIWHTFAVATSRKNTHTQEGANLRGTAVDASSAPARARVIGGKIRVVRFFPSHCHATPGMPLRH